MSKESFARFVKSTKRGLVKHSPEILTGLGIAGMISSVVLAAKATPKTLNLTICVRHLLYPKEIYIWI